MGEIYVSLERDAFKLSMGLYSKGGWTYCAYKILLTSAGTNSQPEMHLEKRPFYDGGDRFPARAQTHLLPV